ncbi:endonuclease domain-containing 1 protein-like [Motacilla alba alba]|uniref:endonuclease domain-containing 1 protein-like n=1 Tax=Motacilla alba alba TaxID=1094192 RepID=UPI0018D55F3C|nr:endonuclease domain-containing 1 protein-like [Motacilla alba alba]
MTKKRILTTRDFCSKEIFSVTPIPHSNTSFSFPLQLIGKNNLKEMEREEVLIQHNFTSDEIQKSQAVNADYKDLKGLNHGHLCPTGHMDTKEGKRATFTLTNAVPQDIILNNGRWSNYEFQMMIKETKGCTSTYVITGAVPGNTYISNKRVNVPSHIWSAACCLVDEEPADAWGAIAENDKNEVVVLRLGDLEKRLTELYKGKTITLFNNACPRK